ncbi:MAG: formate dehydrogenase accessory protein FdhE [Pseudomonadota bacterium]
MLKDLEKKLQRVGQLKKRHPIYKETLHFYECVLEEINKISELKIKQKPNFSKEINEINAKFAKEICLVDNNDIEPDDKMCAEVFRKILDIATKSLPATKKQVEKINKLVEEKEIKLENLFNDKSQETANFFMENEIDGNILFTFYETTLNPFIWKFYNEAQEFYYENRKVLNWTSGHCPVCFSEPKIAQLKSIKGEKGAERTLCCSSCETEYYFPRIKCPFCANDKPDTLSYFYAEEIGKAYRVDLCKECNRYIKTINSDEFSEEVVLPVDELCTIELDFLAEKEGLGHSKKLN